MNYKRITIWILVLILPLGIKAQTSDQPSSFTLQDCIDYAFEHNSSVLNAGLERDIAKAQIGETTAQGLPQLNIDASITDNYNVRKAIIDASNFDPTVPEGTEVEFAFGLTYEGDAGLHVEQMLFNGSYFVGLRAAKTFKELREKQFVKSKIDVIEAVSKSYYLALVSRDREGVLLSNLERYDSLLYETNILFENGFAEKIDLNRIKVFYNNTKVAYENAIESTRMSLDVLKSYMGYPIDETINLADKINDIVFEYDEMENPDFNFNNRIEFSELMTNRELVELDKKNNQVQYLPNLDLFLNVGYNTGTNFSDQLFKFSDRWLSNGNFGISMHIPIFDGLRKSYKIQQTNLQIQQIDNSIEDIKNNINLEIKNSRESLKIAIANLKAQRENMELGEEVYDVTRIKYTEGVGSNQEVIDAGNTYREAQNNYYNALYQALVAKVDLDKSLGKLIDNY